MTVFCGVSRLWASSRHRFTPTPTTTGTNGWITERRRWRRCSRNGAYASFEEDIKGTLTPGKLADYVLLAEDPRETDPTRIIDTKILRTVLGGRDTYIA